ncbi:MAG TPA: hypothetical protein VGR38_07240, partial [Candidatus Polarisedimenticolia bacterium]|nr:hypothetical protein [Candidatus Polarisedimenticolia bacterium]
MARFYPFVGFVVLTISTFFLVSCQWNENTAKRYDVAMKTACSVIDSMTPEKIKAECSNLPEGTQRDNCVSAKNAALDCLRAAKVKAAFAYVYCDKDGLKKAVEKAEKAAKLIQGVWSVVKPLLGDAGGGDTTNINIAASGTLSGGTYNMTILSGSGSTVAVNWGNNSFGQPVIDTFSVTGTASYTITAIGGGNYQVNVSQLRLTLTCSCFNDGTTISITEPAGGFSLVASPNSQVFA